MQHSNPFYPPPVTHQRDIRIRQSELIQHLQLQPLLRPRLTKIPGFWPWTLSRCSTFSRACTAEKDWDCLSYLEDLEFVVDPRDYRAFDLIFVSTSPRSCSPSLIVLKLILRRSGQRNFHTALQREPLLLQHDPDQIIRPHLRPVRPNRTHRIRTHRPCSSFRDLHLHPRLVLRGRQ